MKLKKITIAPVNVEEMVRFYNGLFGSQLKPFEAYGTTLYHGHLAGLELLFCPNELLKIEAEKNRQQLSFVVDNMETTVQEVLRYGGEQRQEVTASPEGKTCGVIDPDGNTIEFVELSE